MIQKKICMLGAFAVGKTSLVSRFVRNLFSEQYLATLGVKIESKDLQVDGQDVRLVLWDMAGEDEFAKVQTSYLRGAAGYLLVIDGTRRSSIDQAAVLQRRVTESAGDLPFLVLVNKSDLTTDWDASESDFEFMRQLGWVLIRTSAKTGAGVEHAFTSIARQALVGSAESDSDAAT